LATNVFFIQATSAFIMVVSNELLIQKAPNVSVLHTSMGMTAPELAQSAFRAHVGTGVKALIIVGTANGTVHKALFPLIRETTERNVPIFVLSDNPSDDYGVKALKYEPQMKVADAGATPLRDVNIKKIAEVVQTIQAEINQGKTGQQLNEAVIEKFGTPALPAQN